MKIEQSITTKWTPWFCWYPVKTIDGEWTLFETIERRKTYAYKAPDLHISPWVEYRIKS